MLWFKTVLAGVVAFGLIGCGYQPLYKRADNTSIRSTLENIHIKPIADRVGQELRNSLYDALSPRGVSPTPQWELSIHLSESTQHISLEQSSFSTRANLVITANYALSGLSDELGHSGNAQAISSYNIVDSDYANLIAERDARSRAVQSLSNDIRRQLAVWFRNHGS